MALSREWFSRKDVTDTQWMNLNYPICSTPINPNPKLPLPIITSTTFKNISAKPCSAEMMRELDPRDDPLLSRIIDNARIRPVHELSPQKIYPPNTEILQLDDEHESSDDEALEKPEWLKTYACPKPIRKCLPDSAMSFLRQTLRTVEERRLVAEANEMARIQAIHAGGGNVNKNWLARSTIPVSYPSLDLNKESANDSAEDPYSNINNLNEQHINVAKDVSNTIDKIQNRSGIDLNTGGRSGPRITVGSSSLASDLDRLVSKVEPPTGILSSSLDDWKLEPLLSAAGLAGSGSEIEDLNLANHTWLPGLFFERLPVLFAAGGKTLRSLKMTKCDGLSDAGLTAISQRCSSLEELDVSGCERLTSKSIQAIGHNLKRLGSLKISRLPLNAVDEASCAAIGRLSNLFELDCSFSPGLTGLALSLIAPTPVVGLPSNISSLTGNDALASNNVGQVTRLHTLMASHCPKLQGAGLGAVILSNPLLAILELRYLPEGVNEDYLAAGIRSLRRLRWVDLSGSHMNSVGTKALMATVKGSKFIEFAGFSGLKSLEDEHLRQLSRQPLLKEVIVVGNKTLSLSSISALAQNPSIERIDMTLCPEVDMAALAEMRPKMTPGVLLINRGDVAEDSKKNFGLRLPANPISGLTKKAPKAKPKAKK